MAILSAFRNTLLVFIAGLLYFFLPSILRAQIPLETLEDTLSRYNVYSKIYYQIESRTFSLEILAFETYLNHLFMGVNEQLKSRDNTDIKDEDILTSREIGQEVYYSVESDLGNFFARKFDIWKQYQSKEMYLQLDRILRLKKRLLAESSRDEKKSMFGYDLSAAVRAMGDGEMELAIKLFTHMIDFYGYSNYDDLLFYRSEAYYQSGQFNTACTGFNKLMDQFPESDYFEQSYFRCLSLDYSREAYGSVLDAASVFAARKESWKYKKDVILYIFGAGSYNLGNYDQAIEYLSQIESGSAPTSALTPESRYISRSAYEKRSAYYNRARYLIAHSLLYKEEIFQAKDAFTDLMNETGAKGLIGEECALICGDMILAEGSQDVAWGYYDLIPRNSPRYPRAVIGKAVCRIMRQEYALADSLADFLLSSYDDNDYIYMARCLKGRVARAKGEINLAAVQYDIILEESGKKIGLADYLTEKLRIVYLLNELRKNQSNYLQTGDEDLFSWYWSLRCETEIMLKRAFFSEVAEVYPEFSGIAAEKVNVLSMLNEYFNMRDEALDTKDDEFIAKYTAMLNTLTDVASMVHFAGYGRMLNMPNYFSYTDFEFEKENLDSLYQSVSEELYQVENDLTSAGMALDTADEGIDPIDRAAMIAQVESIRDWRRTLDKRVSSSFDKLKASPELRLTGWSHIAFHKTMVPGSDFDDLKAKQRRIKDIDFYLQALGSVRRQLETEKTEVIDQ